jgi:hypothetical protein
LIDKTKFHFLFFKCNIYLNGKKIEAEESKLDASAREPSVKKTDKEEKKKVISF